MDSYCIRRREKESSVPSFSSTLLDAIYRSIDEADENTVLRNQTMKKNNIINSTFERVIKVDKWMEKQVVISEKELVSGGVKSRENSERKSLRNDNALFIKSSSSSASSSNSSSGGGGGGGGGFSSSSDVESSGEEIKFNNYAEEIRFFHNERERRDRRRAQQGSISRTKAKALKIYSDLKKLKQPISPGSGRVTNFLNSILVAGNNNSKKIKNYNEIGSERCSKLGNASNCSSYTRSCLSKTPSLSSRGKYNNGDKRSVRFCPVSVIFDEDKGSRRFKPNAINNRELKVHATEKNLQEDKDTRDLLISLQNDFDWSDIRIRIQEFDQVKDDEEGDEDGSCASSDLFELNNLSDIGNGINKYLQELPVYETTSLHSNTVIDRNST